MAYLYRHIRLDKNEPFYVGIGSDEEYVRAHSTKNRNKHWQNVTTKAGYKVQIVLDDLSWEEACEKEKEFISLYGRSFEGGYLTNITAGGEGNLNPSPEIREKISKGVSGSKHGMYGKTHTSEAKRKISDASLKQDRTGFGEKISKSLKGRVPHPNTLLQLKKRVYGKKIINNNTGEIFNSIEDAAKNIGISAKALGGRLIRKSKSVSHLSYK